MTALTAEQRRVVASKAHALEVRAGAGTGKTTTLAQRLARMASEGSPEHRLLAVTFTRDAAAGLTRKLGALLGRGHGVRVGSFHAWAARALADEHPRYLAPEDARRILLRALQRRRPGLGFGFALGASRDDDLPSRVLGFLSYAKNAETTVAAAIDRQFPALAPWHAELEALAERYHEGKGERLDYDDLLLLFRDRLARSASFRKEVVAQIDHLAVDEYQDVNRAQADIVRLLTSGRGGASVTVVGDPRQSIYGFRGGGPEHFEHFLRAYGARGSRLALTVSFRSTRAIVAGGNAVLPDAHPLRARPKAPAGTPALVVGHEDALAEARAVATHLEGLIAEGAQPQDCAVLVRSRALAGRYAEEARERSLDVPIRTIHAAKGLEWDHVVLMGAREGGLPSAQALAAAPAAQPALLAEERRLLYVAATRARKTLLVTWPQRGERREFLPSRFVGALVAQVAAHNAAPSPLRRREGAAAGAARETVPPHVVDPREG